MDTGWRVSFLRCLTTGMMLSHCCFMMMMALMEFDDVIDGNDASHRMTIEHCI
jgi:hypothetical protein